MSDAPAPSHPASSRDTQATPRTTKRLRRFLPPALVALALAGGFTTYAVSRASDDSDAASALATAATPPAPRVTVAPVEERLFTEYEELTGRVDALETVELRARVSGHLDAVRFEAGQLVQQGDVLFVIDPRWYRAQADLATAEVERARARVGNAEREAARAEKLFASATISAEESDTARTSLAEARAALLAAEAALTTARLDLEHTEVRAPISGRVSRALVTPGNLVSGQPGGATVLTRIVSTGEAYVYADADELTVLKFNRLLAAGRLPTEDGRIPVELQLGDEAVFAHRGYLESTDNRLDPTTGSLSLRMVFPNRDGQLVPGLFARVRIPVSAPERALLVSERAIGTDQSQKFVFAVAPDNTVAYRTITLGPSLAGLRVVRDGLHAGEKIIVNGLQRVRPGMTVDPEVAVAASAPVPPAAPSPIAPKPVAVVTR